MANGAMQKGQSPLMFAAITVHRWLDTSWVPVKKLHAERGFQVADRLGNGGLDHSEMR